MENHEKRRKKRLQGIDWLLLSLALGVLLGSVLLALRARRQKNEERPILYTLSLWSVSNDPAEENGGWNALMPTGAAVTNERGSIALGWVEQVSVQPSLVPSVENGKVVFIEQSERADLYVTVRAYAAYRAGDCHRVADLPILCGNTGDFRIGAYLAKGCRIVRLEEVTP
jgi:hypothetical protein